MSWTTTRMSMEQMEAALRAAGIPTDPADWTAEQVEEAGRVLDAAQERHVSRLARR